MNRNRQKGLAVVEFSIVALVLFMMIFGVIEVGRAFFVSAALDEATRRGARMAAVCWINDPAILETAAFDGAVVPALDAGDFSLDYLDQDGNPVANPGEAAGFNLIRYVRVSVVGFQHRLFVPLPSPLASFTMPAYETVLPRESLGVPREGEITAC